MLNHKQQEIIQQTLPIVANNLQHIINRFYELLFINHPQLKNVFNMTNQKIGTQQQALANSIAAFATNHNDLIKLTPMFNQIAHKHVSLGISAEMYEIVGTNLMAAIAEVLGDAVTPEIADAWGAIYWKFANILIELEQQMYAKSQVTPETAFSHYKVINKTDESINTFSLYLEPCDGQKLPDFSPGQYVTIRAKLGEDAYQLRQYSISDTSNDSFFRITIKREKANCMDMAGIISNYLYENAVIGSTWEVSIPAGSFTLANVKSTDSIVFISTGIGITPLYSMLKSLQAQQNKCKIKFIHLTENSDYHTFKNELEQINSPTLHKYTFYSTPKSKDKIGSDFDYSTKQFSFAAYPNFVDTSSRYYICASPSFMKSLRSELITSDIPINNIFIEAFEPSLA